jgi:hypothetical protein
MKRLLIVAACLALATACSSKKPSESATPTSAAQPASAVPAPPAAAPSSPAEPRTVEITDDLVQKYMDYEKQNIAIVAKYAEESRKNLASVKGDTAKTLQQISISEQLSKEMNEKLKAKRAELGLGDAEFTALQDAVGMIANGRMLYNQMGGDAQMAKMEAEQKKQLAAMPEAQRAEVEKTMGDMTKSLTEMKDGLDIRKKYGDKSADVLLKHADELARQKYEALKLLGDKK